MAFHLKPRRLRQPLKIFCNGESIPFRDLTEEELAKLKSHYTDLERFHRQRHVMLLESPKAGDDLTYVWENPVIEVWVRWPSPDGGVFNMPIERSS